MPIFDVNVCKRALAVAAAGEHNMLIVCEPGSLAVRLARRLADALVRDGVEKPPFRAPHHSVSVAGLMGRGGVGGEYQLARNGVLALDCLPDFRRSAVEAVAWALQQDTRRLSWSCVAEPLPPRIVATALPCPCGFRGSSARACECDEARVKRYQDRLHEYASMLYCELTVCVPHLRYAQLCELVVSGAIPAPTATGLGEFFPLPDAERVRAAHAVACDPTGPHWLGATIAALDAGSDSHNARKAGQPLTAQQAAEVANYDARRVLGSP